MSKPFLRQPATPRAAMERIMRQHGPQAGVLLIFAALRRRRDFETLLELRAAYATSSPLAAA
jgi:hypothetical protein